MSGPVFRRVDRYGFVSRRRGLDPASIAYIVKQAARRAGFRHVRDVSGHSFRSGHVSQAVRNGVPEYVVMKQTGHKSQEVLGAYIYKDGGFVRAEPGRTPLAELTPELNPAQNAPGSPYEKTMFSQVEKRARHGVWDDR